MPSSAPTFINLTGSPTSLFATKVNEIFVSYLHSNNEVHRWNLDTNTSVSITLAIGSSCADMFIDSSRHWLYCSILNRHSVIKKSLIEDSNEYLIVAGADCSGSTADYLSTPLGIYLTSNSDLYVADCDNDRVQLFRPRNRTGTTVVGRGASQTISLDCPSHVVLDANSYLFIVDQKNQRIIQQTARGFVPIISFFDFGIGPSQLFDPRRINFDRRGNIYVLHSQNRIVQKFIFDNRTCGKSSEFINC